jgi:cyclopropane fatty-acyl-phospholipid synthase-like methyltransferase
MDIRGEFDCVVAIGLLMFFSREVAREALTKIKSLVKPGGLAAVDVLIGFDRRSNQARSRFNVH